MDIESTVVATEGKEWVTDLPELGDLKVLVAPWENADFNRVLNKLIRALPAAQRADGNIDPAAYYRCIGTAMAKTILFDWENFNASGLAKPFDPAYAAMLLTDPKHRPFRDGITAAAVRVQKRVAAEEAVIVGNS